MKGLFSNRFLGALAKTMLFFKTIKVAAAILLLIILVIVILFELIFNIAKLGK